MTVVQFPRAERASKADSVFPPIMAQEDIDTRGAAEQRRDLGGKIMNAVGWFLICLGALALLGFITGV